MELKRYFLPLRRWGWLIIAATLVAAVSSFVATLRQPPVYQAITTLIVGQAIMDPNPTQNEFYLSQQLATNYADIANRDPVRNATMAALGLTWLPDYIAQAVPNGQFVEIIVTDTVPERAQAVANELANQLIQLGPTSSQPGEADRRDFVNKQLDTLEVQIETTEAEINDLQAELGDMVSARQIADTQNQIEALQVKMATLQENYANLLNNTAGGALNTLSVIEPAAVPTSPIGPNRLLTVLLAAAVGFFLSTGAAYLLEYMDDTLKTREDVERVTGAPILGHIVEMDGDEGERLYVVESPRNPVVEAYRTLRTNLEFSGVDEPLRTLFVASADSQDGKSSVAANLAVVMAQGEKKVILLDADLRKPNVHTFFGMSNEYGLSDVFRGRISLEDAMKTWHAGQITVITAGTPPPNPTELLGSKRMTEILASLQSMSDVVVIDGPPSVVADAAVLSSRVDGVLVVIRAGYTHEDSVKGMMDQLHRAGARVVGVALNRIPKKAAGYFGGHSYYTYYNNAYIAEEDDTEPLKDKPIGWLQRISSADPRPVNNTSKWEIERGRVLGDVDLAKRDSE